MITQSVGVCSSHTSTCWFRRWMIPQTRGRGCRHSAHYPLPGSTLEGKDCRGAASPSWTSVLYLRPLLHRTNPLKCNISGVRLLTKLMQHSVQSQKKCDKKHVCSVRVYAISQREMLNSSKHWNYPCSNKTLSILTKLLNTGHSWTIWLQVRRTSAQLQTGRALGPCRALCSPVV